MILPKISIIIPARNEERIIAKTLRDLKSKVNIAHEIIIVNDCSNDKTKEVVSLYGKNNKNVRLVNTAPKKNGFSNAIYKGIKNATTNYVVIVMADLCDNPKTINKMYALIIRGWDVVCGSRYTRKADKIGGPKIQGFLSFLVCTSLHYITSIPTRDVSNAFKMYRKDVIKNLNFNRKLGVELSTDLALQAYFKGYKLTEIPTTWRGRTVGESKFRLLERIPPNLKIYSWAIITSAKRRLKIRS